MLREQEEAGQEIEEALEEAMSRLSLPALSSAIASRI
jgi:hypothetical protein